MSITVNKCLIKTYKHIINAYYKYCQTPKLSIKSFIELNRNLDPIKNIELNQYWQIHDKEREKVNTLL